MAASTFKLTIHMVSSLDGIIAKKDNSVSWFETADRYEQGVTLTEQETMDFLKTIDCYVMGARTYQHALELAETYGWAYGDVPTIVLTHKALPAYRPNIEFYSGDLHTLVNQRLKPHYKQVWFAGGAALSKDLIRLKLADEIRLSIVPIILSEGTPFLDQMGREQLLHLLQVTAYKNGMVELHYQLKKEPADDALL